MPKISIIVPVYNVEKYLERCINSILNQVFTDLELILINDGSTDNSGIICDRYSKIDNRVKVIHKDNGGQADARNIGINFSKGDYIGFVDSDDEIDRYMYKILYDMSIKYSADISTCKLETIEEGKEVNRIYTESVTIYTNKEAIKVTYDGGLSGYSPCNKLYKRRLFENIKFPVGRIYEDASVLYKLYMNSNKVVFIDKALYKYIRREGSTTNRPFSDKRLDIVHMFNEKYEYMVKYYPEMCDQIKSMYYDSLRNIIVDIVNEGTVIKNYKSINRVSSIIKEELNCINKNSLINSNHKILAKLLAYCPFIPIVGYRLISYIK